MPIPRLHGAPTWNELVLMLNTATNRPIEVAWAVYYYLAKHYRDMGSEQARYLLNIYMKLPAERPSRLHSCVLRVAANMSVEYYDFKFDKFLELWGYPDNLRDEDKKMGYKPDGTPFTALSVRVDEVLARYREHRAAALQPATDVTIPMVAVKVFVGEKDGRSSPFVKLVGPRGEEEMIDIHRFPLRPSEVHGRLFEVQKHGNRVTAITLSGRKIATLFPPIIGYVARIVGEHNHYHIYDSLSRHFVAEAPRIAVSEKDFVLFSPIIPARDRFKSAIVQRVMDRDEAREAFGTYDAAVTVVMEERGFFSYRLLTPPRPTPEGTVTPEGTASLSTLPDILDTVKPGDHVRLLLYLTRCADRTKQNHVAETEILGR